MKKKITIFIFFIFASCAVFAQSKPVADANTLGKWVQFYPNPAANSISFDLIRTNETGHSLQIYNFMGRKIQEVRNLNNHTSIDLQRFHRGIYIYQIRNRKGFILESGKFQIVK